MKYRKKFSHLDQLKRDRIAALLRSGHKQGEIANILGVNKATISREISLRKRKNGLYDATTAEHKARLKRNLAKYQGMKIEQNNDLKEYIIEKLKEKRSPDEISGRLKREKKGWYASKNAIYNWLYSCWGQQFCCLLCTRRYNPRKRKSPASKRVMIPNKVSIDKRPKGAGNYTRYSHWEVDTAVAPRKANNAAAVSLMTERKTKYLAAAKIKNLSPKQMTQAIQTLSQGVQIRSLTGDNGIENRGHEQWGIPTYFADPHSPWQKPVIENNIGLLRRWFYPKGTNWQKITEQQVQEAIAMINHKYRKSLGYRSAYEVALEKGIIKKINTNKVAFEG